MLYIVIFCLGLIGGAGCVGLLVFTKYKALEQQRSYQEDKERKLRQAEDALEARKSELEGQVKNAEDERRREHQKAQEEIESRKGEIEKKANELDAERKAFNAKVISYEALENENVMLKRDLQNIDVTMRKMQLDGEQRDRRQAELDRQVDELGRRYLKENVKSISSSLNSKNFAASKQKLEKVIERCRGIGLEISQEEEDELYADLKAEYEKVVRAELEREEQARIKAQIREEQKREKEIERQLKEVERQREAIQAALDKALAEAEDQHSAEIESLRSRLEEAEAAVERTKSQAEMTKSGHVYVLSNIGSFGDGVFKIGMTRRLDPTDRVKELGDASVPFPFDVHMMISCDDAPTLENALHRAFHTRRLNRMNPRKEFFHADIESIRELVHEHYGEVDYVADPEALEYYQSQEMSEEDAEYVESLYADSEDGDDDGEAETHGAPSR